MCFRQTEEAGCFPVWPIPFQSDLIMVSLVPTVPCVPLTLHHWFEKYYQLNHGHSSFYFGFSTICISLVWVTLTCSFKLLVSTILSLVLSLLAPMVWASDTFPFQVLIFPFRPGRGRGDLLVSPRRLQNPAHPFTLQQWQTSFRRVMELKFPL